MAEGLSTEIRLRTLALLVGPYAFFLVGKKMIKYWKLHMNHSNNIAVYAHLRFQQRRD